MAKSKKDLITIYMLRNALATLFATFLAFMISFIQFYNCSLTEAIQRLFFYDIYTTLYFVMLWVFDYLVFEMSKIIYDIYEEKVTFLPAVGLVFLCVISFFMPILDLFRYNLCFLCLLICMRMVKEMWRRTPALFVWVHRFIDKIKKRPDSGLE